MKGVSGEIETRILNFMLCQWIADVRGGEAGAGLRSFNAVQGIRSDPRSEYYEAKIIFR
jgi:hypothetical protein